MRYNAKNQSNVPPTPQKCLYKNEIKRNIFCFEIKVLMITVNLSRYPLFSKLPDPESYILAVLDQQHAIFTAQNSSLLSYASKEVIENIQTSCIERMDPVLDTLQESADRLAEYNSRLPCLEKSVYKGKVGEKLLEDYLTSNLSSNEYSIQVVSKEKHSGDIILASKRVEVMIDSKYYTHTVPTKEYEKLQRDMKSRNIRCGILVSYSSKIAKFNTTDISIYNDEDGLLCCIILIGFAETIPQAILQGIYFMEVINAKILEKTSAVECVKDSRFGEILKSYNGVYGLLRSFEAHRKTVTDSIGLFERQLNEQIISMKVLLESKIS
jgi:hypothetical protein